jgi:hypothetical protein
MGMFDEVRNRSGVRLISGGARLTSFIFRIRLKQISASAIGCVLLLAGGLAWAAPQYNAPRPGGMQSGAPSGQPGNQGYGGPGMGRQQQHRQEHLPQWFRQHQYLPPWAQERALRSEPGFSRLPPEKQQRLLNRLRQLDSMPPARRERTLQLMEAMERMTPEQRQRVRSTMQQVTRLPEDRKRMMHRAFRDLTQLPPGQRQAVLNSPQFKTQFSVQERQMLETMMSVQPYNPEPPPYPGTGFDERR